MAMGSPIFANIFMEEFERKALSSAQFKPKIWWRFQGPAGRASETLSLPVFPSV
ncbi:hypothetical protein J6590_080229 [Homalodisca vitripennis]|nr:hypothetical protein J6590_080229 [Homalodisca vitripennis]